MIISFLQVITAHICSGLFCTTSDLNIKLLLNTSSFLSEDEAKSYALTLFKRKWRTQKRQHQAIAHNVLESWQSPGRVLLFVWD